MNFDIKWEVLKELTETYAISGFEEDIVDILKKHINFPCSQDGLGSCLFTKEGDGISIMIATHMDEVGFVVKEIDEQGYLYFQNVGNMWSHVLLNQKVAVINEKKNIYYGVIGGPAVHSIKEKEREKVLPIDKLYIDMGVSSKKRIEELGIKVGDMICPYGKMIELNEEGYLAGKAFDNRVSVATGIWLMNMLKKENIGNKVTLAATVQEEVGLRGARTTAHKVFPDLAIAVDTTLAGDTPLNKNNIKLGKGVAINVIDSMTIMNRGLLIYIENLCRKNDIPYQLSCFTDGGTDAGNIHKSGTGIPATTLSIPMRYMHTHLGVVHKDDIISTLKLLKLIIEDLTAEKYDRILKENYNYSE